MTSLRRLLALLWRPVRRGSSHAWTAAVDVRAEIEAALARRRERRAANQARGRKAASTRIHNRFTGDRLVAENHERTE